MTRSHTLLVGATGMLRGAAVELGRHSAHVTSIARTESSLAHLDRDLRGTGCAHHPVPLDYRAVDRFTDALVTATTECGPIDLAVGWFHASGRGASLALAEVLSRQGTDARYFRVLGSAAADPTASRDEDSPTIAELPDLHTRSIVLGFVVTGNRSRWLTDAEISDGVLRAIETDAAETVVGTVQPWSRRP